MSTAQLKLRSGRQAPYPTPERYLPSPKSSLSRLRAALIKSVRADQAERIPRPVDESRPRLYRAAPGRVVRLERRQAYPLRSETGEYSAQDVSRLSQAAIHHILIACIQSAITGHQGHRLWLGLPRAADGVHIHPVPVLSVARGPARSSLLMLHRHVVSRLHLR